MKQLRLSIALLPLLFLLTACPYASEFPLDKPSQKINKAFLGKWIEKGGDEKHPNFFVITESGANQYKFEQNEFSTSNEVYEKTALMGYVTDIGKTTFLNLKKQDDTNFLFYKIQLAPDATNFVLFEVTDNIDEKFTSSQSLKSFFEKNKDLSFFYNKEEKTYTKE